MNLTEEDIVFHFYLGKAISEWASVENTLRMILCACFEKGEGNITWNSLSVGLFSIDGFKAKMDFVEGTVHRRFPEHKEKWLALVKRTKSQTSMRNKLAHWSVKVFPESMAGRRFVLTPWVYPKPKRKTKNSMPPPGSLGLIDIFKAQSQFIAISISLYNFYCHLDGVEIPLDASLEHPLAPPSIERLRTEILNGFLPHLQSTEKSR